MSFQVGYTAGLPLLTPSSIGYVWSWSQDFSWPPPPPDTIGLDYTISSATTTVFQTPTQATLPLGVFLVTVIGQHFLTQPTNGGAGGNWHIDFQQTFPNVSPVLTGIADVTGSVWDESTPSVCDASVMVAESLAGFCATFPVTVSGPSEAEISVVLTWYSNGGFPVYDCTTTLTAVRIA